MRRILLLIVPVAFILYSCGQGSTKKPDEKSDKLMENKYQVQLLTVDPGHFHAALVQ